MRVLGLLVLGAALCGNANALETAAGADNVNTSQVGINAKIDAANAITTASINNILDCQKAGQLFDPTTKSCIAVDEVLAKKIAACTTNKQFYNQNTGACMASAPDLTTPVTNATNLLNAFANCANKKKFYNSTTGTCVAPASTGTVTVNHGACTQIGVNTKQVQKTCPGNTVMVAAISYGIATGAKEWYGNFVCCPLNIQ